jgi:hypothetical protein
VVLPPPSVEPPSSVELKAPTVATSVPAAPPDADGALVAATSPPADVVKPKSRHRLEARPAEMTAAALRRASDATARANLEEANAPRSTLSAQAAALPPGS